MVTIGFLYWTLFSNGCAFNIIPFMINGAVSKNGEGEGAFVKFFDLLSAAFIFWAIYRLTRRLIGKKA
jgi:hypothetical protein